MKEKAKSNEARTKLIVGAAALSLSLLCAFHFGKALIFPQPTHSPNLSRNGFLFLHARDNPQFLEQYRIENDGRYTYVGRIHHMERQSILEKHFAPVQP